MVRKKIDDQLVAQWVQLRRKGKPYRSIGLEFDVDPRTVKSWVERAGEEREKEHWEAVSCQVDAKYLDEHYRMLLKVAGAILDAVHTDPVFVHHELDARVLLNGRIQSAVEKAAEILAERGLDMSSTVTELPSRAGIKDHKTERLGRKLHDALMEHEPELKTAIETWESDWIKFQQERLKILDEAQSLFGQAHLNRKLAENLKMPVVAEALGNKLLNKEPCSSRIDDGDDNKGLLFRYSRSETTRVYIGTKQEVEAIRKAYEWVLSQLSHEGRVVPVEESYKSLLNQVGKVEDYIDHLILMGKPEGQCNLCLNRSIRSL